jgi:hypothetical protein
MPSIAANAYLDYLEAPPVPSDDPAVKVPLHQYPFAADDIWPSSPPRADIFCNASVMRHPLVSPLAAPAELWKKAPPIWISAGEEALADEDVILARRLHQAGVPVVAEMFEGMPHCHGILFMDTPASRRFFESFSGFCRDAVAGRVVATGNLTWLGFKLKVTKEIPLEKASETSDEEVAALMQRIAVWKLEGEAEMLKEWREKAKL